MDIFLLLGVPAILQGDNGTEFTAHVISEIKDFGLVLVMVHGKPRHPQILGSIERANVDVKYCRWPDLLIMARKTSCTDIMFVQFQKNSAYHSGTKRSPYSVSFGEEARVGITAFSLPQEVLSKPDSEEDLLAVIMDQPAILVYISSSDPAASVSSVPAHSVSRVPAHSVSSIPAHSVSSVPAHSVSRVPAHSVSSVPAHSVSSGPASPFPVFPRHQFPVFQSPLFPWVPVL